MFWRWTSLALISTAIVGACVPKACMPVLLAHFVLGVLIGIYPLLRPPSGPSAAHNLNASKGR